jgi:hypothetical protein
MSEMSSIIYAVMVKLNKLDEYLIQDHKYNIATLSFRELKWMLDLEECKSHANPFIPTTISIEFGNIDHVGRDLEAYKLSMATKDRTIVSVYDIEYIKNYDNSHRPIKPITVKQVDSVETPPMDLDDIQKYVYLNLLEKAKLAKKLNIIDGNVTYLNPHAEGLTEVEKSAITLECINNLAYLEHHFKTPDTKRNISGALNSLIIEMLSRSDRRESQAFQYIVRELLQISFNEDGDFEPSLKQQMYNLRGTYGAFATPSKLYNDSAFRLPNQTKYLTAWCDLVNAAQSKNKLNKDIIVIDSLSEYNALNCNPEKQKNYSFEECGIFVDMVNLKKTFYKQKDPYMKVSPLIKCLITRLPKKD